MALAWFKWPVIWRLDLWRSHIQQRPPPSRKRRRISSLCTLLLRNPNHLIKKEKAVKKLGLSFVALLAFLLTTAIGLTQAAPFNCQDLLDDNVYSCNVQSS